MLEKRCLRINSRAQGSQPSYLSLYVSRNETNKAIRKEMTDVARFYKKPKESKRIASKLKYTTDLHLQRLWIRYLQAKMIKK